MAEIYNKLVVKSTLNTILNMIESYNETALKIKQSIIEMDWKTVYSYAYEQNDLNIVLDHVIKNISNLKNIESDEIKILKKKVNEKIVVFKENQKLNSKLLKDSLLTAKLKTKNIFNNVKNDNYSKELKPENNLWHDHSLLLNKLV